MAFENPIVGGEHGELIRESIKSPDYVPGVSGWIVRRDGTAEFNNVTIRIDTEVGGSVVVGPDGGPQVVLRVNGDSGLIQLPTNVGYEATPPQIYSDVGADTININIQSGLTGGSASVSELWLSSGDDDTAKSAQVILGAYSPTGYSDMFMRDTLTYFDTPEFQVGNEILVSDDNPDANYPIRVVTGRVSTGPNTTTLVAADTECAATALTDTYLVNGVAYIVEIQIQTRQSVGASAAGTQLFNWKLWDGAVGGTQIGATTETWNMTVGNSLGTVQFSFAFEYTGITGSKTLRLSCADGAGADTLQVQSNIKYIALVKRLGNPAKITNL